MTYHDQELKFEVWDDESWCQTMSMYSSYDGKEKNETIFEVSSVHSINISYPCEQISYPFSFTWAIVRDALKTRLENRINIRKRKIQIKFFLSSIYLCSHHLSLLSSYSRPLPLQMLSKSQSHSWKWIDIKVKKPRKWRSCESKRINMKFK